MRGWQLAMTRYWRLQGVLFALVVGAAILVALPSVVPASSLPQFMVKHARLVQPSLKLTGGTRIGFRAPTRSNIIGRRMLELGRGIESFALETHPGARVVAAPQYEPRLLRRYNGVVALEIDGVSNPRALARELAETFTMTLEDRVDPDGRFFLRMTDSQLDELVDCKLDLAFSWMQGLVDMTGVARASVVRDDDQFLLDLPGVTREQMQNRPRR